jgi:hypothetical protein
MDAHLFSYLYSNGITYLPPGLLDQLNLKTLFDEHPVPWMLILLQKPGGQFNCQHSGAVLLVQPQSHESVRCVPASVVSHYLLQILEQQFAHEYKPRCFQVLHSAARIVCCALTDPKFFIFDRFLFANLIVELPALVFTNAPDLMSLFVNLWHIWCHCQSTSFQAIALKQHPISLSATVCEQHSTEDHVSS